MKNYYPTISIILAMGISVGTLARGADPGAEAKRLTSLSLYETEGEALLEKVAMSPRFGEVLKEVRRIAGASPKNKHGQVALGALLGLAAWGEKNASKQYALAEEADQAFDRAIQLDEFFWDAWMAKSELYGHSGEAKWERHAIQILEELVASQGQDTKPHAKYAKSKELLRSLRAKHPAK